MDEPQGAAARLMHAVLFLKGRRILWVDDRPEWNVEVADLLRDASMTVDIATSTPEAHRRRGRGSYDPIITDMHRDGEEPAESAGFTLIRELAEQKAGIPVIVYAASFDSARGVPRGVFAYTSNAANVVQLVVDAMERMAFGIGMRAPA